jgi:uncharacterized protein
MRLISGFKATALLPDQNLFRIGRLGHMIAISGMDLPRKNRGYYRDGYCNTGPADTGTHVVAAVITQDFLDFTASRGNDLQTPFPEYGFPGLKPGDGWCLCATRWLEAERAGVAPPINLKATHAKALEFIGLETLKKYERR